MNYIAYKIAWMLLLLGSLNLAYAQKETPPEGGTPKDFTLPEKEEGTLDNGMAYTMVPYGAIPKVQVNLIIKTGNVHEKADQVWLADLTGDLMREGTTSMSNQELSVKMAHMGGELNINVGSNATTISGNVLSEFAPDLIRLISDVVQNPAFPASEIDRLKNDLQRQLSVQSNTPQAQAQSKFFALMYPDHPYGRIFPTADMIDSYDLELVKQFYQDNFGAKRSVLYVVGQFDKDAAATAIEESFKSWVAGPEPTYPDTPLAAAKDVSITDRPGAPQSTLMIGLPVPGPDNQDYISMSVMNALLGGSFASRITSNIREDKGYTYSPSSSISNRIGGSLWFEMADVTTEHTQASLDEIRKEIERLQQEAPGKEELEGIQNYQAGIFVLQNSSLGGIIGQLNFLDQYNLPDSFLTNYVQNIYAVTPEKVKEMTDKYLDPDKMTLVIVGDKSKIEQQIEGAQFQPK